MDPQQLPSRAQVSRDAVQPFLVPWSPTVPRIYIKGCARERSTGVSGIHPLGTAPRESSVSARDCSYTPGSNMNWSHMKPLRSCAKVIRHNWGMLQPHSCLSVTKRICLGGFGIRKCKSIKPKYLPIQPGLEEIKKYSWTFWKCPAAPEADLPTAEAAADDP